MKKQYSCYNKALEINPKYDLAPNNKACTKSVQAKTTEDLDLLEQGINLLPPHYKEKDKDFENLKIILDS